MLFKLDENSKRGDNYNLMSQTIIPRPIAWVVTENDGVVNIAPFSFFMGLSTKPATVMVSVGHRADGSEKDTLANIRKNGKCTICMVEEKDLEKMHLSSKDLDSSSSEAEEFKIKTEVVCDGYPPMIKDVPAAYFCTFNQEISLDGSGTIPLILNVNDIFVKDDYIVDKDTLAISFNPVARIGKTYAFLGDEVEAPKIP